MKHFKMDMQTFLIIASSVIAMGLGLNAHWNAQKSKEESRQKTDSIVSLQNQLIEKSEELMHAQTEGTNQLLGANSFCRAYISNFSKGGFIISLVHEGKYNVYDIKVRAVDVDASEKYPTRQYVDIEKYSKTYDVGSLAPRQYIPIEGPATPEPYTQKRYNFFFSARNGVWVQQYILRIKGTKMFTATKVYKPDTNENLFKEVQDGFLNKDEKEDDIWQKEATGTYSFGK